ncbi:MAG: hypothetical protein WC337_00525 [Candidatus Muiribacteriota bacterium]
MNKLKIIIIFLITFGLSGFLFYSMDFSESKTIDSEQKIVIEEKKEIQTNLKEIKTNIQEPEKKPDTKEIQLKEPKKDNIQIELNEEKHLEKLFKRNIFAKFHKEPEVKSVTEVIEKKEEVIEDVIITDILNKLIVNFILISEYDRVALINLKKYRIDDIIDDVPGNVKIIDITNDTVKIFVQGEEREIKTGNAR